MPDAKKKKKLTNVKKKTKFSDPQPSCPYYQTDSSRSDDDALPDDSGLPRSQPKLMCYGCKYQFTIESLDMDLTVYLTLNTLAKVGARWVCPKCLNNPSKPSKQTDITELKDMMQQQLMEITNNFDKKLEKFQSSITNQLQNCQQSSVKVNDSISTYAAALSKNLNSTNQTNKAVVNLTKKVETINHNVEADLSTKLEMKLKQQKSRNVIIFQVPESSEQLPRDAYQEDFDTILKIIDPNKSLVDDDIIELYRRGDVCPDNPNPRPVIIKFSSVELRNNILKIRDPSYVHGSFSQRVYIHPDRTRLEQKNHKLLVEQLRKRRLDGETNILIRGGKIVTNQSFRFKPQSFWGNRQPTRQPELSEFPELSADREQVLS